MTNIHKLRFKSSRRHFFILIFKLNSTVCFSLSFLLYQSLLPFPLPSFFFVFVLLLHFKPLQFFLVSVFSFLNSCHCCTDKVHVYVCVCVLCVITTCWDSCAVLVIMGPLKWDCWHSDACPVHRVICPNPLFNITLTCTVRTHCLQPQSLSDVHLCVQKVQRTKEYLELYRPLVKL